MPEGDVVWFTARRLHEALAGRALTRSDFRVPRLATADLTGDVVTEAASRGKHLLIRTERGRTVHTHLRMDGSWRVRPAAEAVRGSHLIRLVLANQDWQAVGYQLGVVELVKTAEEWRITGHLGPDLLGPDWDRAEAVRRLTADPGRPIGEALLDQRNLAGIGTWFCAEMLFLRGIDPWRTVGSVDDLPALVDLGHRLLDANKTRLNHVTTGDSRPGRSSWVYGRAGQPCRRCGTPIRRGEQGPPGQERLRFWCPNCQRLVLCAVPTSGRRRLRRPPTHPTHPCRANPVHGR
jgi:endonuclease-8